MGNRKTTFREVLREFSCQAWVKSYNTKTWQLILYLSNHTTKGCSCTRFCAEILQAAFRAKA